MKAKVIEKRNLPGFIEELAKEYTVLAPVKEQGTISFQRLSSENQIDLDSLITKKPPKEIFFPQTETLFTYKISKDEVEIGEIPKTEGKRVLLGVRPCDARSFALLDKFFASGDNKEIYYLEKRKTTIVLGLACRYPLSTCFCTSLGGSPFGKEGLDILLTDLNGKYLIEIVTQRGEELVEKLSGLTDATKEDVERAQMNEKKPRVFDVTSKDGSIQNIIFRQLIVEEEKEYIICENVSERVRAEEKFRELNEELEQRVKKRTALLEATNKELEAFSYSVSHDLRAPLRSIDGFSMALMEEYEDKLDTDGKDYLRRVRSSSQRMGQIIDDLLSLSRISRRELQKKDVNLSEIAEKILTKLQEDNPYRKIDIVIGHKVTANCDSNLIEVVLENLLSNAWKFTSKQEKPWIIFDTVLQDGELVYCVRDNGAGFDMAYANKLFGAFQRLHKDTDFPGFGIGLATVMRIINRHEGRIWAEGYIDRGASFYFKL